MELCEAALAALDILQPQVTSRRGLVLYELHTGLLLTGRQSRDKAALARSLACLQVRRTLVSTLPEICLICVSCVQEARGILAKEPAGTFAGELSRGLEASAQDIQSYINTALAAG